MEYIIAEFLFDMRSAVSVKKLDAEKLETYICNEIIDEEGNILIDLPKIDVERKGYKSSKYDKEILKRQRDRNRKRLNQNNMKYMKKRYQTDEEFRRQHLDRCLANYYKKKEERKQERIAMLNKFFTEKHKKSANELRKNKLNIDPKIVKEIEEKGFYVLKFD